MAVDPPVAVNGPAQILALLAANGRFWSGVAPLARAELARWREVAGEIGDTKLRELALEKLSGEAFNAEVAATLATLAPRPRRRAVVRAIVALEVLFDYLDGRTELLFCGAAGDEQMLDQARGLLGNLGAAVSGEAPELLGADGVSVADGEYLNALWRDAHAQLSTLPGLAAVTPSALAAAGRCAEAQARLHAAAALGDEQLEVWAAEACRDSGLGWREYVGGCASSVLAMHALIAIGARADTREADARALDRAYLAIGAVITTLDSLVDDVGDRRAGEAGYIRLYRDRREIEQRLIALIDEALTRTGRLVDAAHHAMTLAGVAAYYTTHPGAADPENRGVRAAVRRELSPAIWPTLCVLIAWRTAKRFCGVLAVRRARDRWPRGSGRQSERRA